MEIVLGKYAGFCQGAKRAYEMVEKFACQKPKEKIYILGDLLHNPRISQKVKKWGIQKIEKIGNKKNATLIITAHGAPLSIYQQAKKQNLTLLDTTCPKVRYVQKIVRSYHQKNYQIIIVGDRQHKEVKSINSFCQNKAYIIDSLTEAQKIPLMDKVIVVSQTTVRQEKAEKIFQALQKRQKSIKIINTICPATSQRQEEAKKISQQCAAVIVLGGRHSSNTAKLWQIAQENNKKAFFFSQTSALKKEKKLFSFTNIGILAGASTPPEEIKKAVQWLTKK